MQLIDRYVYAVTEHLPDEIRDDVGKELRSNIEDMLPDSAAERDVREVLIKMGNPSKLAEDYNPRKRYLIGPRLYDKYISVLKLVLGICIVVFIGIALTDWAVELPQDGDFNNIPKLISIIISAIVDGILQGALWVTLVFAILERSGVNEGHLPFFNKNWSLDDLPDYPLYNRRKISRKKAVFSIFWTIFFTSLVFFQPQLIAIYIKVDNLNLFNVPLFNIDRLQSYMLFILLLAVFQLSMFIWKFISGMWSVPMAACNAVYNTAVCILLIIMVSDNSLFNAELLSGIAEYTNKSLAQLSLWWDRGVYIFAAVCIALSIWDSVSVFIKCKIRNK